MEDSIVGCLLIAGISLAIGIRTQLNKKYYNNGIITNLIIINAYLCTVLSVLCTVIGQQLGLVVLMYGITSGSILSIVGNYYYIAKCSVKIDDAICTHYHENRSKHGVKSYQPCFIYKYNGIEYKDRFDVNNELSVRDFVQNYKIGGISSIFINPNKPEEMMINRTYPYRVFIILILVIIIWIFIFDDILLLLNL